MTPDERRARSGGDDMTHPEEIVPLTRTMKSLAALLDTMDRVMADDLILGDESD